MSATNVQFSVAVHVMTALGVYQGGPMTSRMLAGSVQADPGFVRRSLSKLVKAGLVNTTLGKNGSCSLARAADRITLLEIYRASGAPPSFAIHSYPEEAACPISVCMKPCLQGLLDKAQGSLEQTLSRMTLAEMVAEVLARSSCKERGG